MRLEDVGIYTLERVLTKVTGVREIIQPFKITMHIKQAVRMIN